MRTAGRRDSAANDDPGNRTDHRVGPAEPLLHRLPAVMDIESHTARHRQNRGAGLGRGSIAGGIVIRLLERGGGRPQSLPGGGSEGAIGGVSSTDPSISRLRPAGEPGQEPLRGPQRGLSGAG